MGMNSDRVLLLMGRVEDIKLGQKGMEVKMRQEENRVVKISVEKQSREKRGK